MEFVSFEKVVKNNLPFFQNNLYLAIFQVLKYLIEYLAEIAKYLGTVGTKKAIPHYEDGLV